jgi:hypothetical protein
MKNTSDLENWTITFGQGKDETRLNDNPGTGTAVTDEKFSAEEAAEIIDTEVGQQNEVSPAAVSEAPVLGEAPVQTQQIINDPNEIITNANLDTVDEMYDRYEDPEDFNYEGRPAEDFGKTVTVLEQGKPVTFGEVDGVFYRTAQPIIEPIVKGAKLLSDLRPALQKGVVRGAAEGARNFNNALSDLVSLPSRYGTRLAAEITNSLFGTDFQGVEKNYVKEGMNDFLNLVDEYIPFNSDVKDWAQEKTDYPEVQTAVELISQFGINAVPAATVVKGLTSANAIARSYMWAAWADYISFDANHTTMVEDFGIVEYFDKQASEGEKNAFLNTVKYIGNFYFDNNPDTAEANRFRLALEGALMGKSIETLVTHVPRFIKAMPWKRIFTALGVVVAAMPDEAEGAGSILSKILSSPMTRSKNLVSARNPTAVKRSEDPVLNQLNIGLKEISVDSAMLKRNTSILRRYPSTPADTSKSPVKAAGQFIDQASNNLRWLYNKVPEATRQRSKLWYDGANKITKRWGVKYKLPERSVAGVIASLSPQKDWFMNVSLAERTIEILANKGDFVFDRKMKATTERIFAGPKYEELRNLIMSSKKTTINELETPLQKAFFLRIYDETYNPRTHRIVSPEGNLGDLVLKADQEPSGTGWGSLVEIEKAVRAYQSNGDPAILSGILGSKHKVRSFYNNIIDPKNTNGDVTIDTHAVAAALLRPLSGKSMEVHHNFGSSPMKTKQPKNWIGSANSSVTGVQGTYGLYADAYRKVAKELGILPRELQSITWEAVRGLFPNTFKTAKNTAAIDAIWMRFKRGKISIEEAQNEIEKYGGGIAPPSWQR